MFCQIFCLTSGNFNATSLLGHFQEVCMPHQMVRQPFAVYRLTGTGPIGFSVIGIPPSFAPPLLAEKLSRWKDRPITLGLDADKIGIALGEFARSQEWAKISDVADNSNLYPRGIIARFGTRGVLAEGLYAIQPDLEPDAIGGYLFIGDLWHWGHTRKYLHPEEAYVPYSWALHVLTELNQQKLVESASDRQT